MEIQCQDCTGFLAADSQLAKNQRKMKWVVAFNLIMMVCEIWVGYTAGSMSLVAEGWHMGSHVGALSIALIAYALAKSPRIEKRLSFGAGKMIPLGGYTSAVILGLVALLVFIESVARLFSPVTIHFNEALLIAVAGLTVNIVSALILKTDHTHGHSHSHAHDGHIHDHNIRSAFLHVLADAVTSVLAISALTLGKFLNWNFLDPVIGIVGGGDI
jgi:cation diffusion facilitator family transporter